MTRWWDDFERADELVETDSQRDFRKDRSAVAQAFVGKPGTGWVRTNCPLCLEKTGKPDHKDSMGFNPNTGGFNCFKCGSHGKLTDEQRESMVALPALETPHVGRHPDLPEPCWGYTPVFEAPGLQAMVFEAARAYIRGRGITDEVAQVAGVGAATWGINEARVLIPLPDYSDVTKPWRGWVGRAIRPLSPLPDGSVPPLYRYAKRFRNAEYLYGEPELQVRTEEPVFVVEGTLDRLYLASQGMSAVAVLGKPLEFHVDLLRRANRPVVICLDGDAHREGWALSMKLRFLGQRAGSVRLPPRIDPDEVDPNWLREEGARCLTKIGL